VPFRTIVEVFRGMPFAREKTYRALPGSLDIIRYYNAAFAPAVGQFIGELVMRSPTPLAESIENTASRVPSADSADLLPTAAHMCAFLRQYGNHRAANDLASQAAAIISDLNALDPGHPSNLVKVRIPAGGGADGPTS
jgi:hypothetical protein